MDSGYASLSRLWVFAEAMDPNVPRVDRALPALLRLLQAAHVDHCIAGGLAVLHHGYPRTTEDIDVLVEASACEKLSPHLDDFGFRFEGNDRMRHVETGVRVDLLVEGHPLPRGGTATYPSPSAMPTSPRDPHVIALSGLVELKLRAARHQDIADVVALLKRLDEGDYLALEASIPASQRDELVRLRRDALEELAFET